MSEFDFAPRDENVDSPLVRQFCEKIKSTFGIVLSEKKYLLIKGRLYRRSAELNHPDLESYLHQVLRDPNELKVCGELLTTHTTQWFREIVHFQWLKPQLSEWVKKHGKVSIWSAACSSGEEVYSLMFLCILEGLRPEQVRILGTDVSERTLQKAQELPETEAFQKQLIKLKQKMGANASMVEERVHDFLKQSVKFRKYNLMDSELPGSLKFDVVFLRNVLIYFDAPTIAKVTSKLSTHLLPGGHLVVGLSESFKADAVGLKSLGNSIYEFPPAPVESVVEAPVQVTPLLLEAPVSEVTEIVPPVAEVVIEVVVPEKPIPVPPPFMDRTLEKIEKLESTVTESLRADSFTAAPLLGRTKIRLLIVEDSPSMRKILRTIYERIPDVEIVGEAGTWQKAAQMFAEHKPNMVSLDLKLEDGTGIDFLRKVSKAPTFHKSKIVLVTDSSASDGAMVMDAMALGARYYIQKPKSGELKEFWPMMNEFVNGLFIEPKAVQDTALLSRSEVLKRGHDPDFIFIGSSTGGTEIVKEIIAGLPRNCPPIIVVQHMPETFTGVYAQRMQQTTGRPVHEVKSQMKIHWGSAYIASGGRHLQLIKKDGTFWVDSNDGVPVNRFKPSISVLFASAQALGVSARSIAIMLTGMGRDGAEEMLHLKRAGALTLAQSEESCAVYGMPAAAVELGAVDHVTDPKGMIETINKILEKSRFKKAS